MIRYTIKLTKSEVEELESIINKGCHKSQKYRAAYILLNTDEGEYSRKVSNEQICKVLRIGMRTIDSQHFYGQRAFKKETDGGSHRKQDKEGLGSFCQENRR